jgi:hypothetical protein
LEVQAKGLEVQVRHLISLGGWNDVIYLSIYPLGTPGIFLLG